MDTGRVVRWITARRWWWWGIGVAVLAVYVWWSQCAISSLTAEAALLRAEAGEYAVNEPHTKARMLAPGNPADYLKGREIEPYINGAPTWAATVGVGITAVEETVAAEVIVAPAEEVTGEWTAETDWCSARFRLPSAEFDLRRKPQAVEIELAMDADGVLYAHSPVDWLTISSVTGLRESVSEWALGAEVRYPLAAAATVRWEWVRAEIGWDWHADSIVAGIGVEVGL